jgi:hypothetical protein
MNSVKSSRVFILAMLIVSARSLGAQTSRFETVAILHLGGDSAQATRIELRSTTAYRVEVRPARAVVRLTLIARYPERALRAMPSEPAGDARAFTLVPERAGEYLVELTNPYVGITEIRVLVDHAPTSAEVTSRQRRLLRPAIGFEVKSVYLATHADRRPNLIDSIAGIDTSPAADQGVEVCAASVPRSTGSLRAIGGCFATFGFFVRPGSREYVAFGVQPRFLLWRHGDAGGLSLTMQASIGHEIHNGSGAEWSVFLGAGIQYAFPVTPQAEIETEAGIDHLSGLSSGFLVTRLNSTFRRVAVGFRLRP